MPLHGNNDASSNTPLWAPTVVNLTPNTTNIAAVFGNTTQGAFKNNNVASLRAIGVFGVDATEMGVSNNSLAAITITNPGTGYAANASVTVGGNGTANATATTGKITAVNIVLPGNSYSIAPVVTIAAPSAINVTANTSGIIAATDFILVATANSFLSAGDALRYVVPASNTATAPLANNTLYYVAFANTTGIVLSADVGGANINLTEARTGTAEVHTLTGTTATANAAISGARAAAHAGWVLRTVGQGGRAGRIQEETLVAMGSMIGDASDDSIMKDA